MKSKAIFKTCALAAVLTLAPSCAHGQHNDSPAPTLVPDSGIGTTIDIQVRRNDRLAMFLFAYHAARSLSDRDLAERIPLTQADSLAIKTHSQSFAPLAQAFEPYLDMHPLRDRELLFMSGSLAGAEVEFADQEMLRALNQFEPIYIEHFAPRHRAATGTMADGLESHLEKHGELMARAVSTAVEGEWRKEQPILLDLVPYVSRAGAYTISFHTVMSSQREDYRNHALEMAFHEAAHTSPMTDRIKSIADAALAKHNVEGRRFWHYLQFYAIGRAAQSVLGDDYVPYHIANGLHRRRSARPFYEAIDAVWDDYDSLEERADAAIGRVAAQTSH